MVLRYQQQDCALTLREGVAEYHRYLAQIGRKAMVDSEGSRLILEHDTTHVIFGMDTSLEQEAGLDTWLLFGCQYEWRYLRGYTELPDIKALYRALISEKRLAFISQVVLEVSGPQMADRLPDPAHD